MTAAMMTMAGRLTTPTPASITRQVRWTALPGAAVSAGGMTMCMSCSRLTK